MRVTIEMKVTQDCCFFATCHKDGKEVKTSEEWDNLYDALDAFNEFQYEMYNELKVDTRTDDFVIDVHINL